MNKNGIFENTTILKNFTLPINFYQIFLNKKKLYVKNELNPDFAFRIQK